MGGGANQSIVGTKNNGGWGKWGEEELGGGEG